MSKTKELHAALGVSWILFTKGGVAIGLIGGWLLATGLMFVFARHLFSQRTMVELFGATVVVAVFLSLAPFWLTLMSFARPKRTTLP